MTETHHTRLEGLLLDRQYRVLQVIDRGGMGVVYEGLQEALKKRVALKVLSPKFGSHHRRFTRFKREAESVASLSHPNVVQVFDFLTHQGLAIIVMEYVEGASFKTVLRNEGPLEARRVVSIATQVLSALEATHAAKIVHRDLKPGNVIVSTQPGLGEWVKVVDFGIALMLEETGATRITKHGEVLGTPAYMSPEQLLGDPVDRRADIYSLGAMMFKALSGQVPYSVRSFRDLLKALVEQPSPAVEALTPFASMALSRIVVRALSKNPKNRFDTAEEMASALRSVTSNGDESPLRDRQPHAPAPAPERSLSATVRALPLRDPEKPADEPATTLNLRKNGRRPDHEDPALSQRIPSSHETPEPVQTVGNLGATQNLRPPKSRQGGQSQETRRGGDADSFRVRRRRAIKIAALVTGVLFVIVLGIVTGQSLHRTFNSRPSSPQSTSIQEEAPNELSLQPKVVKSPMPIRPAAPPLPNLQTPPAGGLPSEGTLRTYLFDAIKRATVHRPNARLAAVRGYDIDSLGLAVTKTDHLNVRTTGMWTYTFCAPGMRHHYVISYHTYFAGSIMDFPRISEMPGYNCEPIVAKAATLPDSDRVIQEYMSALGGPQRSEETLFQISVGHGTRGDRVSVNDSFTVCLGKQGDFELNRDCD